MLGIDYGTEDGFEDGFSDGIIDGSDDGVLLGTTGLGAEEYLLDGLVGGC
jgi:hypothetical protein